MNAAYALPPPDIAAPLAVAEALPHAWAGSGHRLLPTPTPMPMLALAQPLSPLQRHDLVTGGLPVPEVLALLAWYQQLQRPQLLQALGISERTLQRAKAADKTLDTNASDRALRLAAVTAQAIDVLGSQAAAERWLAAPALALDQRCPIDLLQSSEGTDLVRTLLVRMDHGVYA